MGVIAQDHDTELLNDIGALSGSVLIRLLETSPNGIALIDTDGRIVFINAPGKTALGLDPGANTSEMLWPDVWPPEHRLEVQNAFESACQGDGRQFLVKCGDGKQTLRWWDVCVEPIRQQNDTIGLVLAVGQDVTHHHQPMPKHPTDLLLREIDHRVKNSLAMIAAVLRLQMKSTDSTSVRADLEDAANRILSVSQVHAELYRAPKQNQVELAEYLGALSRNLVEAISGPEITLTLATETVYTDAQTAQALGLILTELVSNAIRHAFPDTDTGRILIELRRLSDTATRLCIYDDGVGLPDNYTLADQKSLGSKIILLYAAKIGAIVRPMSSNAGAEFEIIF